MNLPCLSRSVIALFCYASTLVYLSHPRLANAAFTSATRPANAIPELVQDSWPIYVSVGDAPQKRFEIWVLIGPPPFVRRAAQCNRDQIIELTKATPPSLRVANADMTDPPPLEISDGIAICVFKEDGSVYTKASTSDAGVKVISLIDSDNSYVPAKTAQDIFRRWIDKNPSAIRSIPAEHIYARLDQRWPTKSRGAILLESESAVQPAWFTIAKRGYFRIGLELANSYGARVGEHGNAVALPAVVIMGADMLIAGYSKPHYIGIHFFAAPTIIFQEGELKQIVALGTGLRVDISGYGGVGIGYQADFTGDTKGAALFYLNFGADFLKYLTNR